MLVLLAIQSRSLGPYYVEFDAEVRQLAGAFAQLEPQSILGVALDRTRTNLAPTTPGRRVWDSGTLRRRFWHIAALAAVHAPVFVTTTHAIALQHTIIVQPPYYPLYVTQGNLPWKVSTDTELEEILLQYSEVVNLIPNRSRGSGVNLYLLLLHPATLAERTLQHGDLLFRSENALLVRLRGQ